MKKKKFIIYSDIHILAPHHTGHTVDKIIFEDKWSHNNLVLTGDIVDRENARKKDIQDGNAMMFRLKSQFGDRYLLGNHEGKQPKNYYYKDIETNTLFCHGHTIFWPHSKVTKWENKKLGMSKFQYWKYRVFKSLKKRGGKKSRLNLKDKHTRIIRDLLITYNCKTIVFGHSHRNYDVQYDWGRVINVPQGRTEIWTQ